MIIYMLFFWDSIYCWNLGLAKWCRLVEQWTPGIYHSLPPQFWDYKYMPPWVLRNEIRSSCMSELYPQSTDSLIFFNLAPNFKYFVWYYISILTVSQTHVLSFWLIACSQQKENRSIKVKTLYLSIPQIAAITTFMSGGNVLASLKDLRLSASLPLCSMWVPT